VVSDKSLLFENRLGGITVQDLSTNRRQAQHNLFGYYEFPEEVKEAIEQDLASGLRLGPKQRRLLRDFLLANTVPNLTLNSRLTQKLRQEAAEAVGMVTHRIRQGEAIVRRGDVVSPLAAKATQEMAGDRETRQLLLSGLGTLAMLSGLALLIWVGVGEDPRRDRSRKRLLSECLLLLSLHLLAIRLAYLVAGALADAIDREPFSDLSSYCYAIPLSALALISVLLYGRNTAVVLSLAFSLTAGLIAGGEAVWLTMVYCLSGSLAAIYVLDQVHFRQRSVAIRAGFWVGVVNVLTILTLELLAGELAGGLPKLSFDLVCGFASGLLAAAITSFMIPILEGLLSITTRIKLLELSNPNLPLLRRLALEAPGTFQHSLAVANLAKAGCDAIDADSLLVNTCALYHDVGKVLRPRYFVENQVPGQNPHDKIQASMSALILINHVKEGVELSLEEHLPQPILDGIEQHHGTRLIKFFYNRAKERCDPETEAVREEEFRYPGPKPQSKEMGVLMLADGVEAASRTLGDPSRQKIRNLLGQIFEDCLKDGQLDQSDLTLGDLRQVEDAFQRVLSNIYHRRIDYPGFDFNRGPTNSKKAAQSGEQNPTARTSRKAS
jgi:putative nucleotidyltransferase with HDIG domain